MDLNTLLGYQTIAQDTSITLSEFLHEWANDSELSANAAGRIVRAIGKPVVVDSSKDPRLNRVFSGRTIRTYPRFADLLGIEDTISKIVQYFEHAADRLEQSRQILYLYGPVGSGKSTLVAHLKRLAEQESAWVLGVKEGQKIILSPVFENPLGLFDQTRYGGMLEEKFHIPAGRLCVPMSRWTADQLDRRGGDLSEFVAVKVSPSMANRRLITRVEPAGRNSVDVGMLIGRGHESRKFEDYHYSGGLNLSTQGLMEYPEIFKADAKTLNPLLTATQDRKYTGDGDVGELPYEGIIIAHSNEGEWIEFKKSKHSEGMLDRIFPIEFPYCLRVTEEEDIYARYLKSAGLDSVPIVPDTLKLPALLTIVSRISDKKRQLRLRIYDGQSFGEASDDDKKITADGLRREEAWREGMYGVSPRVIFKWLPAAIHADTGEAGLDPVSLYKVLEQFIIREKMPVQEDKPLITILERDVLPYCNAIVRHVIETAYYEDYPHFAASKLEHYLAYADAWVDDLDYKDPDTGEVRNQSRLDEELKKSETGIKMAVSVKDFRRKIVKDALRFRGDKDKQEHPIWSVLEDHVWRQFEKNFQPTKSDMLALINYGKRAKAEDERKHAEFILRVCTLGCTERQARRLVDRYIEIEKLA